MNKKKVIALLQPMYVKFDFYSEEETNKKLEKL